MHPSTRDVSSFTALRPGQRPGDSHRASSCDDSIRRRTREAAQEAISAALSGEQALCSLRCSQIITRCAGRPWALVAAVEIDQALGVDIILHHLYACDRRRRLHRELRALSTYLRDSV